MESITLNNYQLYAIDYLEGNLDQATYEAFEAFLACYPEIKQEIEQLKDFKLETEQIIYENKVQLKKSPYPDIEYKDYLIIGEIEGVLNADEKKDLATIIEDDKVINDFKLYELTKLRYEKVVYPNKWLLKLQPLKKIFYKVSSVAAVILFVVLNFGSGSSYQMHSLYVESLPDIDVPQAIEQQVVNRHISVKNQGNRYYANDIMEQWSAYQEFTEINNNEFNYQQNDNQFIKRDIQMHLVSDLPKISRYNLVVNDATPLENTPKLLNRIGYNVFSKAQSILTNKAKFFHQKVNLPDVKLVFNSNENEYKIVYNNREFGISF